MGNTPPATDKEKKAVVRQLPFIKRIKDAGLRDKVIDVWIKFWRDSGYASIGDAPGFRSDIDGQETLVRHTIGAARMSEAAARQFQQVYHARINYDILLAGAALHDVDKIVLYERKGDKVEWGELGRKVVHGVYGAGIAEKFGIPGEVLNIMASHSPKRTVPPQTIEAVLITACDEGCFQGYRILTGKGFHK